jgi:hypothetical protein
MSDCFPVTAVAAKATRTFSFVATLDFEAIGALDRDLPVVSAFTGSSGMALKEQMMLFQHAINSLGIWP